MKTLEKNPIKSAMDDVTFCQDKLLKIVKRKFPIGTSVQFYEDRGRYKKPMSRIGVVHGYCERRSMIGVVRVEGLNHQRRTAYWNTHALNLHIVK